MGAVDFFNDDTYTEKLRVPDGVEVLILLKEEILG
jgi:hypothetical protein